MSDGGDIRRYIASLDQSLRMFGHHRDADATPEEPEEQLAVVDNLDAELAELEEDIDVL